MAYRRRQGIQRATTFKEETNWRRADVDGDGKGNGNGDSLSFRSEKSSSSSLAAQAIRASAAHRDSSLSSAYANSAFHSSFKDRSKDSPAFGQTSPVSPTEAGGFWGVVARKAKAILENGNLPNNLDTSNTVFSSSIDGEFYTTYQPAESSRKLDNPRLRKGLDALATSLNQIGDTIGTALEEGRTIVGSRTADIIQETRKLQNRRREEANQASRIWHQNASHVHMQASQEDQLKASRDVAMATAAKAKLLLRELKTVKADLAFAKQRCSQLEEENRILREARDKGDNPADDDMIRRQLETLLAEKSRLANENSLYSRENRFLREIVEYHQLTMQDIVYLDEGIEEVTEVGLPRVLSASQSLCSLQSPPPETSTPPSPSSSLSRTSSKEILHTPTKDVSDSLPSSNGPVSVSVSVSVSADSQETTESKNSSDITPTFTLNESTT